MTDFEKIHSFESLYNAYRKARQGKRWKGAAAKFEVNLLGSGIGDPVFVPAVDSGDGIHLPLMVVFCFRLCLLVHIVHRSGRTPLLPLYALLLFKEPSELTLRTLLAFDELGVSRCTPNVFQALVLSRFFHAVVMYFTSSASFDQYSQLLIEIKPISCESSMKNRGSLQ